MLTNKPTLPQMLQVKEMTTEDFEFAIETTDSMNWNLTKQDFQFMLELEPHGCFTLLSNHEKIGIAATVTYDTIAWFGNLIVKENHRKKGAGTLLLQHSINYLKNKNVKTIGLYAYLDRIHFYKSLGFQQDTQFILLTGKAKSTPHTQTAKKAEKQDTQTIIEYDSQCFGASRKKLLEPILLDPDNLCYLHTENNHIIGYAVAKVYRGNAELGPLVCQQTRSDIATNLLNTILNKLEGLEVSICIPEKQKTIQDTLAQHGLTENQRVARMYLGTPTQQQCVLAAESLERG
jgi:N-acetylglutamate synthase-like GNAT family acetyltransferase